MKKILLISMISGLLSQSYASQNNPLNSQDIQELEAQFLALQNRSLSTQSYKIPNEITSAKFLESGPKGEIIENYCHDETIKESLGLSIDGGGIRGLMPAIWLAELEEELQYDHQVSLSNIFDFIGGTSIGGILGLGVACDIPAQEFVNLLRDEKQLQNIFPKTQSTPQLIQGIEDKTRNSINFYTNLYESAPLQNILQNLFADRTLDQLTSQVTITACSSNGVPYIFNNSSKYAHGAPCKLWEVARCAAAAPGHFSAYELEGGLREVDGGLWANNPAVLIAGQMTKKFSVSDIYLLSLGTGVAPSTLSLPIYDNKFCDVQPVIDILMNSNGLSNHIALQEFLGKNHYKRVNCQLDHSIDLDDTDASVINLLTQKAAGQRYLIMEFYGKHKQTIRRILERRKNKL